MVRYQYWRIRYSAQINRIKILLGNYELYKTAA